MMVGRFQGREIIDKPACPFCGGLIERPRETSANEMPLGSCSCGAVFACDVTGHNLGTALSEALVSACQGDWDSAWNLLPEQDYLEELAVKNGVKIIQNYNLDNTVKEAMELVFKTVKGEFARLGKEYTHRLGA